MCVQTSIDGYGQIESGKAEWPRGGGILRLIDAGYVPLASQSPYPIVVYSLAHHRRLCLNHTVQKDSREVLGTSFRFRPTSEILENIQYGGPSVVKSDS